MKDNIKVHGLSFRPYLSRGRIAERITELGQHISQDYQGKSPIFLAVLNGAFMFAADLIRACEIDCSITFIRLSSYDGLGSSGQVKTVIGLQEDVVKGKDVIIIEDIVDTGQTMAHFLPQLEKMGPASVAIASLLVKTEALECDVDIHYTGFEIPTKFVIGYGLDYDGLGRNIPDIYQLDD
ncbi:MAG: hypoxanthine phosphoribosyltransferase [Lewinellaceae bacterium]|nr:hypoxanthine phosphoribosyltransferase [Phaeodactylibacter sp.]MCB9040166.1 hypoxanthine phosphoribosyltransferase [Lewinellaceae bacterium]